MSSVRGVRPHLHHLMIQLARRRNGVSERLPLLRLEPEMTVVESTLQTPKIQTPQTSQKIDSHAPFGHPPDGWMPKKQLWRVLKMLHDEVAVGGVHAHV